MELCHEQQNERAVHQARYNKNKPTVETIEK